MAIAHLGVESRKFYRDELKKVRLVTGAYEKDGIVKTGIGAVFSEKEKGMMWGRYFMPLPVIRSWRAIKILERTLILNEKILCACWEVTKPTLSIRDSFFLNVLKEQMEENPFKVRNEVMDLVPEPQCIISMVRRMHQYGVDIDARDISREIEKGKLPPGTLVEALS